MSDPTAPDYQPFYCEENVARLVQSPLGPGLAWHALFITNAPRAVALWEQRLAPPSAPIVWDYHVVALQVGAPPGRRRPALVFDLDTRLGVPCELHAYLADTFRELPPDARELAPRLRLVSAAELARTFASDRRHMRAADGAWLKPPPRWPLVTAAEHAHTLDRYLDFDDAIAGEILSLAELAARFAGS